MHLPPPFDVFSAPSAGLLHVSLIWLTYLGGVGLAFAASLLTVLHFQGPRRERSSLASGVAVFTLTALLATALLLPVDIALVSATGDVKLGRKKDWATPGPDGEGGAAKVLHTMQAVYYALYSLDAVCCLLVVPFAYFWWEEGEDEDDVGDEDGDGDAGARRWGTPRRNNSKTFWRRLGGALKYSAFFLALVLVLFLVGFFVPTAGGKRPKDGSGQTHLDLDFFKRLLAENRGERALTFAIGLLVTLGTLLQVVYTAPGLAILPISLIRTAPALSAPQLAENTATSLEQNRDRQRQINLRADVQQQQPQNDGGGRNGSGLSSKDRRELEALMREERTLVRRERLAAEARGDERSRVYRAWVWLRAAFRPLKLVGGVLLVLVALLLWTSVLMTAIDKVINSVCGARCGYILGAARIPQPLDRMLLASAAAFPVDYALTAALVLFLFAADVSGMAAVGIRFLWIRVFALRGGRTTPQALLVGTVLLALLTLALHYAFSMLVAPTYAAFGTQTFCASPPRHPGEQPDCAGKPELVRRCSEAIDATNAGDVCTPTVMTTLLNRATLGWPVFGDVQFYAQFAFLAVYAVVFATALVRTPHVDWRDVDDEAEADEEEGLLASTGRRFGAAWQDVTGRPAGKRQQQHQQSARNGGSESGNGSGSGSAGYGAVQQSDD